MPIDAPNISTNDSPALRRAYERCRDITRTYARNFHYGIRLTPEPKRSAIYAVYAWMRQADDLADASSHADMPEALGRIDAFGDLTEHALSGHLQEGVSDDPIWLALAATAARFRLAPQHFRDVLDGQRDDVRRARYDTMEQLSSYCRKVASTVGLICIDIWGFSDSRAPSLAVDRGIAFQLTNILRDVVEDHDRGRTYLPAQEFLRLGMSPDDLRHWRHPSVCKRLVLTFIDRAIDLYDRSAALDNLVHPSGRATLWAMTAIYRRLLDKIAVDPSRIVTGRRIRVSTLHKSAIAMRAKWLARSASGSSVETLHAKSTT